VPDFPRYRQIASDLRDKIESGVLARAGQPPAEAGFGQQYAASRNTVRDALRLLADLGGVQPRAGYRIFVAEKVDPFVTALADVPAVPEEPEGGFGGEPAAHAAEISAQGRRPRQDGPTVEIQRATGVAAEELQLGEDSFVVVRTLKRYIDGTPYSLQTTFYPMRLVEQGATDLIQAQDMPSGAVRYLEEKLGMHQAGWRDRITVRPPDANEAEFFHLAADGRTAVFETFRTAYNASLRPFRLTVTVYASDRNQFVQAIGRVPPRETRPAPGADVDGLPRRHHA
jgi:GntR family transcriptional regulator